MRREAEFPNEPKIIGDLMSNSPNQERAEAVLLPCPFCGSKNIDPEGWVSTDRKGPACDDCSGSADTIELWNSRPLTASPPAEALPSQTSGADAGALDAAIRLARYQLNRGSEDMGVGESDTLRRMVAALPLSGTALAKPASEPAGGGGEPTCWTSEVSLKMAAQGVPAVIHAYPPPVEPVALYREPLAKPAGGEVWEALAEAIEFAEQDIHALTPVGEAMVERWRAVLSSPASSSPVEAEALPAGVEAVRELIACLGDASVSWSEAVRRLKSARYTVLPPDALSSAPAQEDGGTLKLASVDIEALTYRVANAKLGEGPSVRCEGPTDFEKDQARAWVKRVLRALSPLSDSKATLAAGEEKEGRG